MLSGSVMIHLRQKPAENEQMQKLQVLATSECSDISNLSTVMFAFC